MYPFYEKIAKSGIKNVCIHKGLFAPGVEVEALRRQYALEMLPLAGGYFTDRLLRRRLGHKPSKPQ